VGAVVSVKGFIMRFYPDSYRAPQDSHLFRYFNYRPVDPDRDVRGYSLKLEWYYSPISVAVGQVLQSGVQ